MPAANALETQHSTALAGSFDSRSGTPLTTWRRARNTALYWTARLALGTLDRLPLAWLRTVLAGAALVWYCADLGGRRRVQRALALALPVAARPSAWRVYRTAARNLAFSMQLRKPGRRASHYVSIDARSRRVFDAAARRGAGIVFVSAHFGPFELIGPLMAELGYDTAIVARESFDPRLTELTNQHRVGRVGRVYARGAPSTPFGLLRRLRGGYALGLLADLPGRGQRTLSVSWFGREVSVVAGPATLARQGGAELLVGYLVFRQDLTRAPFQLHVKRVATRGTARSMTQRVISVLERAIGDSPCEWLWMAPRLPLLQGNHCQR